MFFPLLLFFQSSTYFTEVYTSISQAASVDYLISRGVGGPDPDNVFSPSSLFSVINVFYRGLY